MFVHKDIIIVFVFIFLFIFFLFIVFIRDIKRIVKDLQNFSGEPITPSKIFFFGLFEPIAFNINSIISKHEKRFRQARLRLVFYDYFFKNFPDPLLIIDQRSNIIEMNLATIDLLGKKAKGENVLSVLRIPELGGLIEQSIQNNTPIESEVSLIFPKERTYRIWISGSRSVGENKLNFIRLYDSTSEHNIQNIQKDFIANASHELKTPISSILGYCETLLNDKSKDSKIHEKFLNTIFNETNRMSSLVNDLLSLTRIEKIEFTPPDQHINLVEILKEVENICNDRNLKEKSKYKFQLPKRKILVIGDKPELKQVFLNIIENAIMHSQSKKPIKINLKTSSSKAVFSVEDFGVGISNQNIPLLTKRFFRIDTARSRKSGNTGLGLSIVKHSISRHNAELNIESEPNKGSKFSITFNI